MNSNFYQAPSCTPVITMLPLFRRIQSHFKLRFITLSNIPCQVILRHLACSTLLTITLSILIVQSSYSHSLIRIYKYTTKKIMDVKYYFILMWRLLLYSGGGENAPPPVRIFFFLLKDISESIRLRKFKPSRLK